MSVQYQRRYFNVSEYYRMAEAGVLTQNDHVELIEGEIIEMSPIGSRHAACVRRLGIHLTRLLGQIVLISIQNPVRLNDYSEPEPDVALLKLRDDFYAQSHPTPEDTLLIIEVADTSAEYDRGIKMPLYAQAGIAEAWLVNLPKEIIEIYTEPLNGSYQKCRMVKRGEILTSETITTLTLDVSDVLG
ncbi:MAG TPA: Uma2 family endonuclease [Blastocatellia bacterium]|nr:Uma2 family endonuclease [Blastocatellia bacterium]